MDWALISIGSESGYLPSMYGNAHLVDATLCKVYFAWRSYRAFSINAHALDTDICSAG
jgi:hypothetical protein